MPFYQRLGDVPRKRHIQFCDNGTLLTEEVMGMEGFVGMESILYHLQSPCRVMKLGGFEEIKRDEWVPDTHAHRHFMTYDIEGLKINPKTMRANYLTTLELFDGTGTAAFKKDTPNDVAPGGYNMADPPPGLPVSPLEPQPSPTGFRWGDTVPA